MKNRNGETIIRTLVALAAAAAIPSSFAQTTQEEFNSPGVYQINAQAAHNRPAPVTGANVTIVIVDTGLHTSHPEFAGRVLPGYNVFDGSQNAFDGNGHGTHVAGILGAGKNNPAQSGMFGAAYQAYLMPIRVLNNFGFGTSDGIARGIQVAANRRNSAAVPEDKKPFAMNLSLGSSSPSVNIEASLRNAITSINGGMVIAAAAGNNGGTDPGWPARYAKESWANGQILAVGAVDSNNVIAGFSNRAGDTRNFYLVAPGVYVFSTFADGGQATYEVLSGTSMATPYVTGAAALIKSGWPFLTARQVASILLATATDLGAPGVDPVYGHGLLNLSRAQEPVGQLAFPTASGTQVLLAGTALTSSPAAGGALLSARNVSLLKVSGFDDYGRDYAVDLAPSVRRYGATGNSLAPVLASLDSADTVNYARGSIGFRFMQRSEVTQLALGQQAGERGAYVLSAIDGDGREVFLGLSGMGGHSFGLAGDLARRGETHLGSALFNPFFSLAKQHMHSGFGMPLWGPVRMRLGMLVADERIATADGVPQNSGRQQYMTVAEVSAEAKSTVWTLSFGRLQEENSVLGASHSGALGYAGTGETNVVSLGAAFMAWSRLTIGAQYTSGYTAGSANTAPSLVSGYSDARSTAYTAFVSLREAFGTGDRVTMTLSQPMRITSGTMQMLAPYGVDAGGTPVMESRGISLRPDGREVRADLIYTRPFNRDTAWSAGLAWRRQPDHDAAADNELQISAGLRWRF
jgi:subtilisin family serine protease